MDAVFKGERTMLWIPGELFRLRAVISKSGRVKIRLHENEYVEKRYDTRAGFDLEWDNVTRLGTCGWDNGV